MILLHPITLKLLAGAATYAVKNLPVAHLARMGLVRTLPVAAPVPMLGAAFGGVLVTALAIPQSRTWLKKQATSAYDGVRNSVLLEESNSSLDESSPRASASAAS